MSYSRILVPIDFSELSERAAGQAASLAGTLGASLTLLHVHERIATPSIDPAFRPAESEADQRALLDLLERKLRSIGDALALDNEGIAVRVETGDPLDEIMAACRDHSLVVLATHGRRGLGQFLLGSVTERVVRGAGCSVLVVR